MHNKKNPYNRAVFILSLMGIAIAVYVTQSFIRKTGILCVNTGCELVRKSPASYLFGSFPVPAVGLIGYTILAACSFLKTTNPSKHMSDTITQISIGMASFGLLFVGWFTYTELFIIKGICTWCLISAMNMILIFGLTIRSYALEKKSKRITLKL